MTMQIFPIEPPSSYLRIELHSIEEATSLASFPVKLPPKVPAQFRPVSLHQYWPDHIDAEGRRRKVHADFLLLKYADSAGHLLHIVQGFTGMYIAWTNLGAPSDSVGSLEINGRKAAWLTALPAAGSRREKVNGKYVLTDWTPNSFSYLGWQDGVHPAPAGGVGDSPRYYGLTSDVLSIAELAAIAESVPATPFVVTP